MMKPPEQKKSYLRQIKSKILDLRRDVIRMMRLRFIAVAMSILIIVFLIMLTAINMIMNTVSQSQSMQLLQQIADSPRYNSVNAPSDEGFFQPDGAPPDGFRHSESDQLPTDDKPSVKPDEKPDTVQIPADFEQDGGFIALDFNPADRGGRYDREPGGWNREPQQQFPGGREQGGFEPPSEVREPPQPPTAPPAQISDDDDDDDDNDDNDDDDKTAESKDDRPNTTSPVWEQPPTQPQITRQTDPPVQTAAPPPHTEPQTAAPPPETHPVGGNQGNNVNTAPSLNPRVSAPTSAAEATTPPPEPTEAAVPANIEPQPTETVPTVPPTETTTVSAAVTETSVTTVTTTAAATSRIYREIPPDRREQHFDRWKVPISIDHFAILVSADDAFIGLRNTEDYTEEQAIELMDGILSKAKPQGMYGWLQYCIAEKDYGKLIVITDKTSDQGLLNNLFRTTVIIGILMLLVLLVILIFLSRGITQPVEQAFTRQKQFVSDAGHELKTPLAVLTTNADILQDEIGENKWLIYMQEQIGRMNQLVGDLLRLARMDNAAQTYVFEDFDLSMAVAATTLPFESTAFEQHRNLEMDVQPDVHYCGSEQHIRQLCAIFIDNAIKYSNENGVIKVTLLRRGDHQILEFYNTGCEISQDETQKIFERFYRGDKARSSAEKSGYGLGLAIAKSIMDVHKIKFHVTCEQGRWIRFLLTL